MSKQEIEKAKDGNWFVDVIMKLAPEHIELIP